MKVSFPNPESPDPWESHVSFKIYNDGTIKVAIHSGDKEVTTWVKQEDLKRFSTLLD